MRGRSTSSMTSRCSSLLLSASAEARSSGDDVIAFKGRIHRQWSSRTLNNLLIFTENLFENLMEYSDLSSTLSVLFRGDPQPATSFYADGRSSDDVIAFWRYVLTQHPRCPTNPSDEQDLWERNLCINTPASEFGWMGYANQFIVFSPRICSRTLMWYPDPLPDGSGHLISVVSGWQPATSIYADGRSSDDVIAL